MPSSKPVLINATIEQLNQHAEKLNNGTLRTWVELHGIVPEWESPFPDVLIAKQYKGDPVLTHVDMMK